ncbi:MAG: oligosaccharide flippase family protein [Candidatus Woesearchaeota archaeon]
MLDCLKCKGKKAAWLEPKNKFEADAKIHLPGLHKQMSIQEHLDRNEGLLRHTSIVFIAALISNGFNYIYQLFMGRTLGPEQYGVLGSLFSMIYVITVINCTVLWVVSRYVTQYNVRKEYGKIKTLILNVLRIMLLIGAGGFILMIVGSGVIANFLHIDRIPVILVACFGYLTLFSPALSGTLNGLQRFTRSSFVGMSGTFVKLVLGIALVYAGFGVVGAMCAVLAAAVVSLALNLYCTRDILLSKATSIKKLNIFRYSSSVLFGSLLLIILINIDLILVKHFMPAAVAGNYAALTTIGKIILFASSPISGVMFPKVAALYEKKKATGTILKNALFYTILITSAGVICYFAIPGFLANILFGKTYTIAQFMGWYALAIAFYSLNNLLVWYNLARKRSRFILLIGICLGIEIFAIALFHNTIMDVVKIMVVVNATLFVMQLMTVSKALVVNHA